MSWDSLQGADISRASSPVETERFGVSVGRVTVGHALVHDETTELHDARERLAAVIAASPEDVLVVRYPAAGLALAVAVGVSGRDVLPAGSLVYWSARTKDLVSSKADPHLRVVPLGQLLRTDDERAAVVDQLVAESFVAYGNHYRANPLLAAEDALAGYQEWARRTATQSPDDALVLLHDDHPVGLATVLEGKDPTGHLEVLLAGLRPDAQGRGWYGTLLAGAVAEADRRGRDVLVISTQAHNVRVQRAWSKAGLRPIAAIETVHAVRRGLLPTRIAP